MIALLLAAAQAGPPAPTTERRETIVVRWDAQAKSCVPRVRGVETGDVATEGGRRALGEAIADKGATLDLIGSGDLPFGCMVGVTDALKQAGFYGRIVPVSTPSTR